MPDQPSGFTVTDRRKFTIEGDLREGASAAEEASAPVAKPAKSPHHARDLRTALAWLRSQGTEVL